MKRSLYSVTTTANAEVNNVVSATADALDGGGNVVDTVSGSDDATLTLNLFDVVVTKSVKSFNLASGAVTWTINAVNSGPGIAPGPIVLADVLDSQLSFVSTTSTEWTCNATGQTISCNYAGDLAVGEALNLEVLTTVSVSAKGVIPNHATVTVSGATVGSETNLANNDGSAQVTVTTPLPVTGSNTATLAVVALALMAIGSMMLLMPRINLVAVKDDDEDESLES